MGSFYDNSIIPTHLRRDFDVYDHINTLDLDLGSFDQWIDRDLKGANICSAINIYIRYSCAGSKNWYLTKSNYTSRSD